MLRRGSPERIVPTLAQEFGVARVFWSHRYDPLGRGQDASVRARLTAAGITTECFNSSLLFEPRDVKTAADTPFRVFTPFWRATRALPEPGRPLPAPKALHTHDAPGDRLEDWALLPTKPDWAGGLRRAWTPGEIGARRRLDGFLRTLSGYGAARDVPAAEATSRLSPHLHFGEISPRQIWHALRGREPDSDKFRSELGWREFNHHLLFHHPQLPEAPLDRKFSAFPWRSDAVGFAAWTKGRTGFPIVDAGMRQLWTTGWMHNRVRMIAASFLVKHLGIDWRRGAAWFWDTLVDADLANNAANWQWVAGCGADAAPFFRIFNPVLQGEKFDPDGAYVRRWIPELNRMPDKYIHKPWAAPSDIRRAAKDYPQPILDLATGRLRALAAFRSLSSP